MQIAEALSELLKKADLNVSPQSVEEYMKNNSFMRGNKLSHSKNSSDFSQYKILKYSIIELSLYPYVRKYKNLEEVSYSIYTFMTFEELERYIQSNYSETKHILLLFDGKLVTVHKDSSYVNYSENVYYVKKDNTVEYFTSKYDLRHYLINEPGAVFDIDGKEYEYTILDKELVAIHWGKMTEW